MEMMMNMNSITSTADGEGKLPEMKSFWTSTTIRADLGLTI